GTSIAVNGYEQAGNTSTYNWSIDNGLGGSGTIDQSLDDDFAIRWPELIVNGLTNTAHTLTITASGDPNGGRFPSTGGFTQLDAFDIIGVGVVPEPSTVLIIISGFPVALGVLRRRRHAIAA